MNARAVVGLLGVLALRSADPCADARAPTGTIDPSASTVEVQVSRSGLLSAFGHDHRIAAKVASGHVLCREGPRTEIAFDARTLRVADGGLSDSDRERVQATMEGPEVLDAARYPEVVFRSTSIEAGGADRWSVAGSLTLHGETHAVRADVVLADGRYRGATAFKLTDFGIRPPVAAGGTVRVRDEVRIVFDVAVRGSGE
jgi:polyisoprenoid-binding protein YceI